MVKKIRLICIQTYHSHWANHSGYHHFLSRLPKEIQVSHIRIPRGTVPFNGLKGPEKIWFPVLLRWAKNNINPWTTENDLLAEFRLLKPVREAIKNGEKVIIHFLDGEIGFNFFGSIRKLLMLPKTHTKLIASYHQPCQLLENVLPHSKRTLELDLVITVGRSQFPFFDFIAPERLRFVPHGIDSDYFHPSNNPKNNNRVTCLTVGHWLRDFDALEKIASSASQNLCFRVVAGKEHVGRFRDRENIELFSGVSDKELLHLYQSSDIGLMPLEDSTANNALLEMMACGLPVVSTRVGSVADYLTCEAGIMLEENNPDTFLAAINSLADSTQKRAEMGKAARERALELSWDKIADDMAEIYRKL